MGFPGGTSGKESAFTDPANAGDMGSILGPERSPGEGNGNPLQYSFTDPTCSTDGRAWEQANDGTLR